MNYLAHAYLSFNRPDVLVGNMISDFVKGKKKYDYAPDILSGIDLHRAIDDFTDMHPVTKSARQIFQPDYGLYSGAFMDVAYDYFIANDKQLFEPGSLETFCQDVYDTLDNYTSIFPPRFNHQYFVVRVFTQSVCQHTAGRPASNNDCVKNFIHFNKEILHFLILRKHFSTGYNIE